MITRPLIKKTKPFAIRFPRLTKFVFQPIVYTAIIDISLETFFSFAGRTLFGGIKAACYWPIGDQESTISEQLKYTVAVVVGGSFALLTLGSVVYIRGVRNYRTFISKDDDHRPQPVTKLGKAISFTLKAPCTLNMVLATGINTFSGLTTIYELAGGESNSTGESIFGYKLLSSSFLTYFAFNLSRNAYKNADEFAYLIERGEFKLNWKKLLKTIVLAIPNLIGAASIGAYGVDKGLPKMPWLDNLLKRFNIRDGFCNTAAYLSAINAIIMNLPAVYRYQNKENITVLRTAKARKIYYGTLIFVFGDAAGSSLFSYVSAANTIPKIIKTGTAYSPGIILASVIVAGSSLIMMIPLSDENSREIANYLGEEYKTETPPVHRRILGIVQSISEAMFHFDENYLDVTEDFDPTISGNVSTNTSVRSIRSPELQLSIHSHQKDKAPNDEIAAMLHDIDGQPVSGDQTLSTALIPSTALIASNRVMDASDRVVLDVKDHDERSHDAPGAKVSKSGLFGGGYAQLTDSDKPSTRESLCSRCVIL